LSETNMSDKTHQTAHTQTLPSGQIADPDAPRPPDEYLIEGVDKEILRIELDKFSGPFEVLLYLIRSQEIDIFDIPIVKVTEQYLRFLDMLQEKNLEVAGDFLVMAATLIQIKSRMILPLEIEEEEEEIEEEDPRLDLVEKLLEYRKFRDLTEALQQRVLETENWFGRRVKPQLSNVDADEEAEDDYLEVSLYDLIRAIRAMMRYVTDPAVHEVVMEGASVDDKIGLIEQLLLEHGSVTWVELFRKCRSKIEIVCCLLAILELCRMRRIYAQQHRNFGDIRILPRNESQEMEEIPEQVEISQE